MPQPPGYTPTVDFSEEEAASVAGRSSVRTSALDAELANIASSIAQTLTNLAITQRDDGQLRDGIVKIHTFSNDALALMGGSWNPRGVWVTATAYAASDVVTQASATYVCAVAHTAGTFATDYAANKWIKLFESGAVSASAVAVTPAGNIASTDAQNALEELDSEKVSKAGANTISGNNTHSGSNTFSGLNTFSNINEFTAINNFTASQNFNAGAAFAGAVTVPDAAARNRAASAGQVQDSSLVYAVATGTDTYAADLTPAIASYTNGLNVRIKIPNANMVTNPTLNVNSKGAKTIYANNGSALTVGAMAAGSHCILEYDATLGSGAGGWLLLNAGASASGGAVSDVVTANTNTTLAIGTHDGKLVQTTSGNPAYTFPTAVGNQGKTLVLRNGTSSDTGLRLVPNGAESLGGATGSNIYHPAYTTIGYVSDGANWIVFFYSGKRLFRFEGSGTSNTVSTFHVPPGFYSGLGTVVGGGGGGTDGIGSGATGGTSSIGGLLQATGGAGVTGGSTAVTTGGTPNGQRGGNGNNVDAGGNTPFGKGGIGGNQTHLAASGFGAGGKSSNHSGTDQSTGASGGWRIDEVIALTPGAAITITAAGGGAKGGGGTSGGEDGRPGLVMVKL